jgi:hypothetical protein
LIYILNLKNEKEKKLFKSNLETIMQYFCIFSKYNYNGRNIYRKNIFIGFILFQFGKKIFFLFYIICLSIFQYVLIWKIIFFFKINIYFYFWKKIKLLRLKIIIIILKKSNLNIYFKENRAKIYLKINLIIRRRWVYQNYFFKL